jgi:hypothetical protein
VRCKGAISVLPTQWANSVGGDTERCLDVGQAVGIAPNRSDVAPSGVQLASQGAADAAAGTRDEGDRSHGCVPRMK